MLTSLLAVKIKLLSLISPYLLIQAQTNRHFSACIGSVLATRNPNHRFDTTNFFANSGVWNITATATPLCPTLASLRTRVRIKPPNTRRTAP